MSTIQVVRLPAGLDIIAVDTFGWWRDCSIDGTWLPLVHQGSVRGEVSADSEATSC